MRRILSRCLLLSLLLSLPAQAADTSWPDLRTPPAASAGDGSKDAALVIGIEDYAFAQDIPGAAGNARAWEAWLRRSRHVPMVKTLLDHVATREEILLGAKQMASRVRPGGLLWVVFIGHGAPAQTGNDGMLVGVDAQQTALSLDTRSVTRAELLGALGGGKQSQTVLVLDACFSGKTSSGDLAPGLAPLSAVSERLSATGVTVLTAGRGDEYAGPLSDGSRPAFSYLVLGALRGWGDQDGDGLVRASEAVAYANDMILQTVTGRSQRPTLDGDGSLVLGRGREAGPDLSKLTMGTAGPSSPSPVRSSGVAELELGGKALDFAALAAQAAAADAAKRQAAAAAAEAAAALQQEQRRRLDAAASELRTQATKDYGAISGLVRSPTVSGAPVLEAYLARYGTAKVRVGEVTEPVEVPELAAVQAALAAVRLAPSSAGTPSGMSMRKIPAGTFTMGCTSGQSDCGSDEKPTHTVRLTHSFLLGATEVTQGQWQSVMGKNPSYFSSCGTDCPVEQVSWVDAAVFANAVSNKAGLEECYVISGASVSWPKGASCMGYRLPTESEWEYAARAGGDARYAGGDEAGDVAWTGSNSGGKTHKVGTKASNAWGLLDMSGNVWEWVWDGYGDYPSGSVTDPTGASTAAARVNRGGGWDLAAASARLSLRDGGGPGLRLDYLGLRVARSLP